MRLPERSLLIALLGRAAIIWLLVRLMIGAGGAARLAVSPKANANPFSLSDPAAIATVLIVGGLGLLEARRRNEDRFLANLGVSSLVIAMLSMVPACLAEIAIGVIGPR